MSVHRYLRREDSATVYRGIYMDPNGTRRCALRVTVPALAPKKAHTDAATKVRHAANIQRAHVESGTWVTPLLTPRLTLSQLAKLFQDSYQTKRGPLAFSNLFYQERLKVWIEALGQRDIRSLTREEIERTVQQRIVGDSTRRKDLAVLNTVYKWALRSNLVSHNPCLDIMRPPEPRHRVVFLTEEQESLLLAASSTSLGRVVRFAIGSGMDRAEIIGLAWPQVKSEWIEAPRLKTNVPRHIPLNATLQQLLAECKEMRHTSQRVFLRANNQPWTTQALKCALKRAYVKAGFTIPGPFKVFRHTFGTRLAATGASPFTIRDLMGHTNTATTDKYTHAYQEHLAAAMKGLDRREA